jgi:hypothetical protein
MFGANFGIGAPVIITLHLDDPASSPAIVWVATVLTIGLCAVAVNGASRFLPRRAGAAEPDVVPAEPLVVG